MKKRPIAGSVLAVLLVLGYASFFTVSSRSRHFCIDCRMYFQDRVMLGEDCPVRPGNRRAA